MGIKPSKPIKNFLLDFGLSDKEIELYLTLLKTGPSTIMDLSRESGIKRSTTHNNVEELIKKGMVSQTNYGERRMVVAEDPAKLKFLMDQKAWNLKKLEENLPDVVSLIQQSVPQSPKNNVIDVKYYDGLSGIKLVYEEALSAKELRSFANLEKIFSAFPDNVGMFTNAHKVNKDIELWEIVEDSKSSRDYASQFADKNRYHYKFAPTSLNLSAVDVLIYDGKVAIINVGKEVKATVLSNEEYYDTSKTIFDFVWQVI